MRSETILNRGLVAVVVTHNRPEQLRQTLSRLSAAPKDVLQTIVVFDNASDSETQEVLHTQTDPRQHIIRSEENLGGAGGFETALRQTVQKFDPDWVVLMDDDARPNAETLANFHAHPRDTADAWLAAVRYPDGEICEMNRPWINPFWHKHAFFNSLLTGREGFHISTDDYQVNTPRKVDGGSFVGLFLSRQAIKLAGYPDGAMFIYGDDVLYTLKLTENGGRISFDPNLTFEHDCGMLHASHQVMRPVWKAFFYHRNQLIVYRQTAGPILFWPVAMVKWLNWRARAGKYGADRGNFQRLLRLAMRDGLRNDTSRSIGDIQAKISG